MSSNILFFGWNRSLPGRERISAEHFQSFSEYLGQQQREGKIAGFEPVFLEVHGGTLNGFFLIRGEGPQLDALMASEAWTGHMIRAGMHLDQCGAVRGSSGALIQQRMAAWIAAIPAH